MARATAQTNEFEIFELGQELTTFWVYGIKPMLMHNFSDKARQELLMPTKSKKLDSQKESTPKHDPEAEFRDALYLASPGGETAVMMPSRTFKRCISTATVDVAKTHKTEISRWVSFEREEVPIWGVPRLHTAMVRIGGFNGKADVRTRAIFWPWAARLDVLHATPNLTAEKLSKLIGVAGLRIGIGDDRKEKGGDLGLFELVSPDDERLRKVMIEGGPAAQREAIERPDAYDAKSRELVDWFKKNRKRTGKMAEAAS